MDIGRAFAYISEDEAWAKKLLIGAIVGAIPILNFAIFGYQAQITRNVVDEQLRPLPDWQDMGKYFVDGLRIVGAMLVYTFPLLIVILVATVGIIVLMDPTGTALNASSSAAPPPPMVFALMSLMLLCTMPYTFLIYGIWPLLSIQIAQESKFSACFKLSAMWAQIRAQPVNYLLIIVLLFGLYMAASFVIAPLAILILIPCLGFIVYMLFAGAATLLVLMVIGHLQGQFIQLGKMDIDELSDSEIIEPM